MKLHKIFLFAILCMLSFITSAQKILVLTKPGLVNRIRYPENTEISFKLKKEHIVHTGNITQLNDSGFLLNNLYPININEIKLIINYKKGYWARFGHRVFLSAGILYYGIGTLNRIFFAKTNVLEKKFILTSAALVGGSFLFTPFTSRRYRINRNRYLKVLDVTIGP